MTEGDGDGRLDPSSSPSLGDRVKLNTAWIDWPVDTRGASLLRPLTLASSFPNFHRARIDEGEAGRPFAGAVDIDLALIGDTDLVDSKRPRPPHEVLAGFEQLLGLSD